MQKVPILFIASDSDELCPIDIVIEASKMVSSMHTLPYLTKSWIFAYLSLNDYHYCFPATQATHPNSTVVIKNDLSHFDFNSGTGFSESVYLAKNFMEIQLFGKQTNGLSEMQP